MILFNNFFSPFCTSNVAFMTLQSGQMEKVVQSGGEVFDPANLDTYLSDNGLVNMPVEQLQS